MRNNISSWVRQNVSQYLFWYKNNAEGAPRLISAKSYEVKIDLFSIGTSHLYFHWWLDANITQYRQVISEVVDTLQEIMMGWKI